MAILSTLTKSMQAKQCHVLKITPMLKCNKDNSMPSRRSDQREKVTLDKMETAPII